MMAEVIHRDALRGMCRLCGQTETRKFHDKHSLSKLIKDSLAVNISEDEDNQHPPSVCDSCRSKLTRWRAFKNKNIQKKPNIIICEFQQHGQDCTICQLSKNVEEISWMTSMINLAKEKGYHVKDGHHGRTLIMSIDDDGNTSVCVIVQKDGQWIVKVHGREVNCDVFSEIPQCLETKYHCDQFLLALDSLHICPGNPEYFLPSHLLKDHPLYLHYSSSTTTIRHNNCPLLTNESPRCLKCRMHRSSLGKLQQRHQADYSPAPKANYRWMSQKRLSKKLQKSKTKQRIMARKISKLEDDIEKMFKEQSQPIGIEENKSFSTIFTEETHEVHKQFEEGSRMRILWDEQHKSIQNHPNAMRWHPAVLRLCIALQAKSSASYELLRNSGFLNLPHKRTLKQYTNFTSNKPGFNQDRLQRIISDIRLQELPNHKRNVVLSFDEMKVSEGLVYSHACGSIIGFTSLGSLSDEFELYTRMCKGEKQGIANHVLTLMIRAISDSYKAVVAHFATSGCTSDQLFCIMNEAIELLELSGFRVRALVSDGASQNRKFYDMLREHPTDTFINPFSGYPIYMFSDAPHLLKTCRNNLENSGYHGNTRNMMFRGLRVSWKHIVDVYNWDLEHGTGLRMLHHITEEHIHLTPSHRMKVKLAAQVLSSTMANALIIQGRPETASTALFINYIDTFFDCMNVSQVNSGKRQKKPALHPYRDTSDWRFTWLEEDFLSFLEEWETEGRLTPLTRAERDKLCLSKQTLEGLKFTVKAFVHLTKELLTEPGVEYILSEKFSQDPLEEHFSKQRGIGGRHDNPTVSQFGSNLNTLQVAGAAIKASKRSNVTQSESSPSTSYDSTPLPRKRLFKGDVQWQ